MAMFLQSVKSAIDVISGTSTAAGVTQEQLDEAVARLEASLATAGGGVTVIGGGSGGTTDPPDLTPPGAPTGLIATGGFSSVILEWDQVPASPPVAFTTIYRAAVDDFSQAAPVGTSRVLLYSDYVPDSQNYYYWITFTTEAGVEGPPNSGTGTLGNASLDPTYTKEVLAGAITDLEIAAEKLTGSDVLKDLSVTAAVIGDAAIITAKVDTAAIVTAHIQDAAIIDAKIASLGADKIVASSLSAVSANLGVVTAGEMRSPDNTFRVDLSNKEILVTGPAGQAADDYTVIRNGVIEAYEWNGAQHLLAKALRGIASGVASNGATVTLSQNYFRNQPNIIVSPADIPSYLQASSSQDQNLQCFAANVVETAPGNGIWQFDATAQLVISGGTELQSPGLSFADSQIDDQYLSSVTTLSSSATKLTVATSVRTYQSNGTAGVFFNRQVTVTLEYRIAGSGGAWTIGGSTVTQINQETNTVNINVETGTIPADQYEVRLRYVFQNTGGTYNGSGGGLVPQPDVTRTASDVNESISIVSAQNTISDGGTAVLQSWSPPAGAVITNVEYAYDWTAYARAAHRESFGDSEAYASNTNLPQFPPQRAAAIDASNDGNPVEQSTNGSEAFDVSDGTYDPNTIVWGLYCTTFGLSDARADITMSNIQATISYSLPATTDTDPHNFATWDILNATLSGSTVLSSGTVNWLAIGES